VLALLWRFGYDRRALFLVVLCALIVFPVCFVSFEPTRDSNDRVMPSVEGRPFDRDFNINWVHGFYDRPSRIRGFGTSSARSSDTSSFWCCRLICCSEGSSKRRSSDMPAERNRIRLLA
jgi:hypothetical protein